MKSGTDQPVYPTHRLIRDLYGFMQPYRVRYTLATILRLSGDLARLYPALAIAQAVTFLSQYQLGQPTQQLWWYIGSAGAAYTFHVLCRQYAKILGYHVAERSAQDAVLRGLRHLFLLDLSWHERENSGNKLKRMQKGGEGIDRILRMWITNFIEIGVNFVGITIILATIDLSISGAFLFYMVGYYFVSSFFTKRASAAAHQVNIGEEELHGLAFEAVNNIRSVKVLGMKSAILERVSTQLKSLFTKIRQRIFWFQTRYLVLGVYSAVFRIGMIALIAWGIVRGQYEVGFLVLFIDYFNKITENIDELAMVTLDFVVAKFGVSRLIDILREPVYIDNDHGKQAMPTDWQTISLDQVSFAYADGKPVLRDVSFQIRRGEKVGIVGVSGAGKSTLFKLLLKEHEHYTGRICIDDVPVNRIRRTDFFRHTAVVLQDTEVFNFTLQENITLANPDEADNTELLQQALEIAHVEDFMDKLPQGLKTYIGEKGVRLSGGEKQRVGIARAVFKQPEILFLDEATSHLDMESEDKIRDSLHHFFQQVTAVVIAHRLSTIKEMDRIIVLQDGQIAETGTFDELYQAGGRFRELWDKQKF